MGQTSDTTLSPARPVEATDTVARYRIVTNAPPRLTDAVAVGDRFRLALVSESDGHPVFTGRGQDGEPLRGHKHAHYLPEALGRNGHVTHVTLHAPMGFDEEARRALSSLERVWHNQAPEFEFDVVLLGLGEPIDFAGMRRAAGHCLDMVEARRWRSRTPFVPTRHPKHSGDDPKLDDDGFHIGSPRHDLRRLLLEAGFVEPDSISSGDLCPDHTVLGGKATRWLEFRTKRPSGRGRRSSHRGFGFEIIFPEPVRGPICLGYGAHYGLGRFEPVTDGG